MSVGKRIKKQRELLNLSQNKLAKKSGVSQSAIHYIESDENSPTHVTLKKLANALEVPMSELLDDQAVS